MYCDKKVRRLLVVDADIEWDADVHGHPGVAVFVGIGVV